MSAERSSITVRESKNLNIKDLLQPFRVGGDIALFLVNFESTCEKACFSSDVWPQKLLSLLPCDVASVVARLSKDDWEAYDKVKAALLHKYRLSANREARAKAVDAQYRSEPIASANREARAEPVADQESSEPVASARREPQAEAEAAQDRSELIVPRDGEARAEAIAAQDRSELIMSADRAERAEPVAAQDRSDLIGSADIHARAEPAVRQVTNEPIVSVVRNVRNDR